MAAENQPEDTPGPDATPAPEPTSPPDETPETGPTPGPDTPGAEPGPPPVPDATPGDTAPMPPADPWAGETELRPPLPPDDAGSPPADRGPGGTGVLPPVPSGPPPEPRWSARAQVRPPDVGAHEEEWIDPGRSPWLPVLVAVGILILIGLVVLGAFLLLNNRDNPGPVTPTASIGTTNPPPSSPAPTSRRPTSAPPTSSAPAQVAIPEVKGLTFDQAAAKLQEVGLVPNRVDEISSEQPAGRVVGTNPAFGSAVEPGTKIDVIVSKGLPTASPTPTPTPTASASRRN